MNTKANPIWKIPIDVLPKYVMFEDGTALRLREKIHNGLNLSDYYRDAGRWFVYIRQINEKSESYFITWSYPHNRNLHRLKLLPCTEAEWRKSNGYV